MSQVLQKREITNEQTEIQEEQEIENSLCKSQELPLLGPSDADNQSINRIQGKTFECKGELENHVKRLEGHTPESVEKLKDQETAHQNPSFPATETRQEVNMGEESNQLITPWREHGKDCWSEEVNQDIRFDNNTSYLDI